MTKHGQADLCCAKTGKSPDLAWKKPHRARPAAEGFHDPCHAFADLPPADAANGPNRAIICYAFTLLRRPTSIPCPALPLPKSPPKTWPWPVPILTPVASQQSPPPASSTACRHGWAVATRTTGSGTTCVRHSLPSCATSGAGTDSRPNRWNRTACWISMLPDCGPCAYCRRPCATPGLPAAGLPWLRMPLPAHSAACRVPHCDASSRPAS